MKWPVIDTHNHIGARPDCTYLGEELIADMDKSKQDMAFAFQMNENWEYRTPDDNPYIGNDYIFKIQSKYKDRIIGLATINPWYQGALKAIWGRDSSTVVKTRNRSVEEVERCIVDLGLHGLKFHPMLHGFHINDQIIMPPIIDKLNDVQKQVNRQMVVAVHCMSDSVFNTPEALRDLAVRYPDIIFLMVHAGAIWCYPTVMEIAKNCKNIVLDFTWVPAVGMLREAIRAVGANRISVGTDSPFSTYSLKHALVEEATEDEHERQMILGGTIAKILGISKINDSL